MLIAKIIGKYRFAVDSLALAAFLAACPAISRVPLLCCWLKHQNAAEHEIL